MPGLLPLGSPYSDVRCDRVEYWEERLEKTSTRYRQSLQRGRKGTHWRSVRSGHLEEAQTSATSKRRPKVKLEGTVLEHTAQDERRARRQAQKAQRVHDTMDDMRERRQLRREERVQQHAETFGGKPAGPRPHTRPQRTHGSRASKHRLSKAPEPQLDESREVSTSSYWFSPPPTKEECMCAALRSLVTSTPKHCAGSGETEQEAICVVCACELFVDEEDTELACEGRSSEDAHSDSGRGSDSESEAGDTANSHQPGRLFLRISALKPSKDSASAKAPRKLQRRSSDNVVAIRSCGHRFHRACISRAFEYHTRCPVCLTPLAPLQGPQPKGSMSVSVNPQLKCAGHASSRGTIVIHYNFPGGRQDERHENPGHMYSGTGRIAFLPNNSEGREVLRLLQVGFDRRVLFRVGTSITTGMSNTVVWNGIHHKTYVGRGSFGYPDPTYLSRVTEELRAWGIE